MPESFEPKLPDVDNERTRLVNFVRSQLNLSRDYLLQESAGGNAGRSPDGQLRFGLNAFVHKDTGLIISIGNKMIEDSNASGVTFLYETDPKNILSGTFKNVHENGIGRPPSIS